MRLLAPNFGTKPLPNNRDSSVSVDTRLRAGITGFDPRKGQTFFPWLLLCPDRSGALPASYSQGTGGSVQAGTGSEPEVNLSAPCSAKVVSLYFFNPLKTKLV
jgi:hypothetical protein